MSGARFWGLLGCVLVVVLAGCSGFEPEEDPSLKPLSPRLVAAMEAKGLTPRDPILVRIYKKESELEVWKQTRNGRYALLKTYPICRWSGKLGPKKRNGDRQAPEGFYEVTAERMNPRSQYHLSFNLGYPNPLESALGYTGEALMVHGACTSSGCYAITDDGVGEVYALAREALAGGQSSFQVQAFPFRMTAGNMAAHRNDPNYAFWKNLEEGADQFDVARAPPTVGYCGGKYVFNVTPADPAARLDPLGPCPSFQPQPDSGAVAAKHERDEVAVAALVRDGVREPGLAYQDGGMHPSFRETLRRLGPDRLAKATSRKDPVSRPDAALADPYSPN